MTDKAPSLLEPASAPPLFSSEEWQRMEKGGEFTGERLFAQRPEAYRAIVHALAQGTGIRMTARSFGVSTNTIYAVLAREGVAIDTLKTETVKHLQRAAAVGAERIADHLESGPAKLGELSVSMGIVIDKLQLLSGEATVRIEHRTAPSHDDINRFLDSLPAAQTVSDGEKETQQGARPALPGGPVDAVIDLVSNAGIDSKSSVSPFKAGSDTANDTDSKANAGDLPGSPATTTPTRSARPARSTRASKGGGGGTDATEGVVQHTDSPITEFQQGGQP